MPKVFVFTAAQKHALDVLIGQWCVLGHTRPSDIHAGTVRALIGHGYLADDGHTITRSGFDVMGLHGAEIDALGPAIEKAQRAAGEVRAIRAQLRAAAERERVAERAAVEAVEQARAMVRGRRDV